MKFSIQLTSGQKIECDVAPCHDLHDVAKKLHLSRYSLATIKGKQLLYLTDKIELIEEL